MVHKQSTLDISADLDFDPAESMSQIMRELAAQPLSPAPASAPQPQSAPESQMASQMQETIAGNAVAPDAGEKQLFSRYHTIRELGRGGMGLVLLAQDEVLEVPVALKLIPKAMLQDTDGIANLKKEVLRGRALAHPGIVRIHNFEQEGRIAVIVMEYVEGESLAQHKARQPDKCFDVTEVRPWLEQLASALDYAHHEAQIAHRDLKPGNILITPEGRLKITDFGLASSLSESLSRMTARQGISGTPPYMSPQQLRGERPTHLDDIYSLGATIYELLTGMPPFFRGNVPTQVLSVTPPPMTERRVEFGTNSRMSIPAVWEGMVAACLSKDAEQRPASVAAMLRMLDAPPVAQAPTAMLSMEVPTLETQEVVLRPAAQPPVVQPIRAVEPVQPRRAGPKVSLQPLVGAVAALIRGIFGLIQSIVAALIDVLKPVLKVAAILVLLGGALFVKHKWDVAEAKRAEAAAQSAPPAAASAPAMGAASVTGPPTYYPPPPPPMPPAPPSGPSGGPQGGGPPPGQSMGQPPRGGGSGGGRH